MSIRKNQRKKDSGPMPSTGAGLMRYFDEELPGIKIGPGTVIGYTSLLIVVVLVASAFFSPV